MADIPVEQQIIEKVRALNDEEKQIVLQFVTGLQRKRRLTAREMMKLPIEERTRLLAESAAAANEDFEIFEAYSEEDFDDYE